MSSTLTLAAATNADVHTASETAADSRDRRWWVLAVLGLAQFMIVLDGTVVNIALPTAQGALHFSDGSRQWVVTAYALAFGGLLLLGGRLADMFGRRRLFLIGSAGFALASAAGGAATNLTSLLAARAVQGAFAALLAPAVLSLLATTFVLAHERGKAFGIFGAIAGSGAAMGLLLGGVLTQYLSWRWCLYVNVPLATVALVGGWLLLDRQRSDKRVSLDVSGTVAVTAGLFFVVFGLSRAEAAGWGDMTTLLCFAAAAILLAGFGAMQARRRNPLLPLRVLTDRNRAGAYTATFMVAAGMFGCLLFLTYYLQVVLHFSAVQAGLAFVPMCVVLMAASSLGSMFLSPRVSPRLVIPTGMVVAGIGMALFTRIPVDGSYVAYVLPPSLVFGLGVGLVFGFASNTATAAVPPEDAGVASAMVNVGQQIGGAVGTALLNTVASSATKTYLSTHPGSAQAHLAAAVHGYTSAFWVAAAVFAVGSALTATLLRPGVLGRQTTDGAHDPARRTDRPRRNQSLLTASAPLDCLAAQTSGRDSTPLTGRPVWDRDNGN